MRYTVIDRSLIPRVFFASSKLPDNVCGIIKSRLPDELREEVIDGLGMGENSKSLIVSIGGEVFEYDPAFGVTRLGVLRSELENCVEKLGEVAYAFSRETAVKLIAEVNSFLSISPISPGSSDVARLQMVANCRSQSHEGSIWSVALSLETRRDPRLENLDEFVRLHCRDAVVYRSPGKEDCYLLSGTDEMLFTFGVMARRGEDSRISAQEVIRRFQSAPWKRLELNLRHDEVAEEFQRLCSIASRSLNSRDWDSFFKGTVSRPRSRVFAVLGWK